MFDGELVVDNFAGGGGASTGIEAAIGRPVDIAVNHSPEAIAMHRANHPRTKHYCEDIWEVDPREACGSRPVGLAWFSPDCTHFSRAKGGQPRSKEVRALAHVVIRWAKAVRPRTILLENVEEFQTWGPLDDKGFPIKAREGEDFRAWLGELDACGYDVSFRTLVAADYGAPTTRKRLFLVAQRRGSSPIVWPEPTHGRGRARPWRTAAEIIDWSLPCPSIFGRKKPLAEATQRRIAAGLRRFVLESAQPFIVPVTHQGGPGRVYSLQDPMKTVTAANRGEMALVTPYIAPVTHTTSGDRVHSIERPLPVVTTAKGGEFVLVAPTLVQTGYGEREGQRPRALDIEQPLGTVVSGGKHALVAAWLTKHYGGVVGHEMERTLGTVTSRDHHSLTTAFLTKFYGTSTAGAQLNLPLPTVTTGGGKGGGHIGEVRAFLVKYYGSDGKPTSQQTLFEPMHTVTTKARFGLVTIAGQDYQIADIGMRMLSPRELFAAQGFPEDYQIEVEFNGKPLTKTAQIELAGNSVCPDAARALVESNARPARRSVA